MKRGLPVLGSLALLAAPLTGLLPTMTTNAAASGDLTCRASAARIDFAIAHTLGTVEPFVANGQGDPCTSEGTGPVDPIDVPGVAKVNLLDVSTSQSGLTSHAESHVANVAVNTPAGLITADVLESSADAACQGDTSTASGTTNIAHLNLNGEPVDVNAPKNTTIQVFPPAAQAQGAPVLVTVVLNGESTDLDGNIHESPVAVYTGTPLDPLAHLDIVIAESVAGADNCKAATDDDDDGGGKSRRCNAGRGNGSEPAPPTDCDPGHSGGHNHGGD